MISGDRAGVPLVYSGTTTSRRGRGPERRKNSCNVVHIYPDVVEVTPHYFESRGKAFDAGETMTLPRVGTVQQAEYPGSFSTSGE